MIMLMAENVPAAHRMETSDATIAVLEATVRGALSVYVPAPPAPEPSAVMVVPAATEVPDAARMTCPTARAPTGAGELATVSVVPEMVAVKEMAPVPAGQKEPAGHAAPVGVVAASAHQ